MTPEWEYRDFWDQFNIWVDRDSPPDGWRVAVLSWMDYLETDKYYKATRAPQLGDTAWFARIPDAESATHAVVCLYTVDSVKFVIQCSNFTTLRKPIVN